MREFGREPVVFVQIDQDFCQLEYGVPPCPASLGHGTPQKCFNTRATCQAPEAYDRGSLTLTFCQPSEDIHFDGYAIPSVVSTNTSPTLLNPGGGSRSSGPLGQRATCSVVFQDHPHSDVRVDPYRLERDYIATERGTFWSKWLARNPYYNNRQMRIYEGYKGQALEEMQSRAYLVDSIDGPDSRGRVTVRGKDVLKLADNDRAQAPEPSQGELAADLNETSTANIHVIGALVEDYPAPGTVRIGDELIRYTSVAEVDEAEIELRGITRATDGSEADEHDAEDRVQYCLRYESVRVDDLAYEWLTEYGDVPGAFIDRDAWDEEASVWLQQFTLSGLITEPTGVTDLLSEITEQCLFYIWWDERVQLIRLEAIKPPLGAVPILTDEANILAGSARIRQRPRERVSQVWVFWGQRDPTQSLNDDNNFRRLRIRADLAAEGENQYDERRIRKIYSRWLMTEAQAINVTVRLLSRYRNNPQYLTIDADAKDRGSWTGDVLDVIHRNVVNFTGMPQRTRWQVVSAEEEQSGHSIRYELELFEYGTGDRIAYWMPEDAPNYEDASDEEKATGAWWAEADGSMPDGSTAYTWT